MSQERNVIIFSEEADDVLIGMLNRYFLKENEDQIAEDFQRGRPSNEVIIKRIVRTFVDDTITQQDFYWALEQITRNKDVAQKLGREIEKNLLPLLDKVPEDQLEEYNQKKEREELVKLATMSKIPPPPPPPSIKHPAIHDVEKNAETLQQSREEKILGASAFEKAQKNRGEQRQSIINQDKYRETI